VGEIGIPRREFLYVIQFWEARRILRGYNKRERGFWAAIRWQTFYLMSSLSGSKHLKENNIYNPIDLMPFPWEKKPAPPMSDQEIQNMQEDMRNYQDWLRNERKDNT